MWAMKDEFDVERYPKRSAFYDRSKKTLVGNINAEARGQSIIEFAGLNPKMYSYQSLKDSALGEQGFTTKNRARGIERAAVTKLHHDQ